MCFQKVLYAYISDEIYVLSLLFMVRSYNCLEMNGRINWDNIRKLSSPASSFFDLEVVHVGLGDGGAETTG